MTKAFYNTLFGPIPVEVLDIRIETGEAQCLIRSTNAHRRFRHSGTLFDVDDTAWVPQSAVTEAEINAFFDGVEQADNGLTIHEDKEMYE